MTAADMQAAAAKVFFTSQHFAVVGATSNTAKFGNKIFAWYLSHSITPIAINPTNSQITINNQQYAAISSVTRLEDPKNTSISIVTPPGVTMNVLREASHAGVKSVWLQPGSFDDAGLRFAMEKLPNAAVGGTDGGGHEGWCVLVDGEASMPAKVGRGVL